MRLKQLELQGYKTFASKTEFLFKGGLTAIIGPNGSGKSNVADAIQWVLGEQSHGRLRAKRSEDMIFSGSNERSRLGMAQASLTLDNSDGWLNVDYGEVVVTRRTYRSGENEYYLNGTRVRLRDISDLLARSGLAKRTYTVIGQGLIDQALSLKPDERRALIEEAAGITGHQAKRATALRELEETRLNLQRVQDILGEIEPRLRYLKVQARRAEERMQIQADLDAQLRLWYGYRWHRALQDLEGAHSQEQQARAGGFDQGASAGPLVAGQVVHDDDVAGEQFGDEHLLDIGLEGVAVDRAGQDEGRDHAAHGQGADEGGRLPVAVREAHAQPLTLRAATVGAGHVGLGPGLVDEHQPFGIEVDLPVEPVLSALQNVGAVLLGRVPGLFLRVRP